MSSHAPACSIKNPSEMSFLEKINGPWHEQAMYVYLFIVLAHWAEHLVQATQIYVLQWRVQDSLGVLGLWYPWLVRSEALHYGYALVMLLCFWFLRKGFVGRSYTWWMVAFWIQFWHHIEHALLQGQALLNYNLFHAEVPMTIAQLVIPRVELHLFYNTVVTIPMAIAMFYHMFPSSEEAAQMQCSCAWQLRDAPVSQHVAAPTA